MQDQAALLARLIAASERIQKACGGNEVMRPLRLKGLTLKLDVPGVHSFLPQALTDSLNDSQLASVLRATEESIRSFRQSVIAAFRLTINRSKSFVELGIPDSALEQIICSTFEAKYHRHNDQIRREVQRAISAHVFAERGEGSKKGNGFGPVRPYPLAQRSLDQTCLRLKLISLACHIYPRNRLHPSSRSHNARDLNRRRRSRYHPPTGTSLLLLSRHAY